MTQPGLTRNDLAFTMLAPYLQHNRRYSLQLLGQPLPVLAALLTVHLTSETGLKQLLLTAAQLRRCEPLPVLATMQPRHSTLRSRANGDGNCEPTTNRTLHSRANGDSDQQQGQLG